MTKPAETKQAIPSPEDRVRAEMVEKAREFCNSRGESGSLKETAQKWRKHKWTAKSCEHLADEVVNWMVDFALFLVEELIPFCDSPCGHSSQYAYSEDGGKNIVCLICEREELKGQVAAQNGYIESLPANWHENSSLEIWFPLTAEELKRTKVEKQAAEAEVALLRKRKDYHAEYVEAVEAAEAMRKVLDAIIHAPTAQMRRDAIDLAAALTPEPASQAAEEKKP